ncbi:MAG: hypothetical protein Q7J10_04750 [Methanosarcinaceae archaeon]|nr:hypothetical protein [Methanosarcinaceae archaeon]
MNVEDSDKLKPWNTARLMRLVHFIYLFFGTVSIALGLRILLQFLMYAPSASQWSHDTTVSLIIAIGAVILGIISIWWYGKNKYPKFTFIRNPKVQAYIEKAIAIGVLALIIYLLVIVWIAMTEPQM